MMTFDGIETADLLAGTTFYAFIGINEVGFFNFPADNSHGTYPGACWVTAAQIGLNEVSLKWLDILLPGTSCP